MPPKNKGKKGKKGEDDFWCVRCLVSVARIHELIIMLDRIHRDKAGESVEPNKLVVDANGTENEDTSVDTPKVSGFSAFSSSSLMEDTPVGDDDEGGGGGLMVLFRIFFAIVSLLIVVLQSLISSSTKAKKDKKKKAKPTYDDDEFVVTNEDPSNSMESKQPVEVTAEALAEEEWGPVKEKKKDKKGKGKKGKSIEDEEEEVKVTEEQGMLTLALGDFHSFIDRCGRARPHISGDLKRQGRGRQRSGARRRRAQNTLQKREREAQERTRKGLIYSLLSPQVSRTQLFALHRPRKRPRQQRRRLLKVITMMFHRRLLQNLLPFRSRWEMQRTTKRTQRLEVKQIRRRKRRRNQRKTRNLSRRLQRLLQKKKEVSVP